MGLQNVLKNEHYRQIFLKWSNRTLQKSLCSLHIMVPIKLSRSLFIILIIIFTIQDKSQNHSNACQVWEKRTYLSRFPFYWDTLYIKQVRIKKKRNMIRRSCRLEISSIQIIIRTCSHKIDKNDGISVQLW